MFSFFTRNRKRPQSRGSSRRPSFRPRLEELEDRCLLSAGALDPTFGNGGIVTTSLTKNNDSASGVLLQSNGDLVPYGGSGTFELARYTPSGSLDPSFGSGGIVSTSFRHSSGDGIQAAALQSDGKIVAVGVGHVVRYNANGSLDTTFGSQGIATYPSGFTSADSVLLQPNTGDIVIGGSPSSSFAFELVRYTPKGILDTSFGQNGQVVTQFPGVNAVLNALALENGDIVAAGWAGDSAPSPYNHAWALVRYNANGGLDTTFGPNGTGMLTTPLGTGQAITAVRSLVVQPDGKVVAVGEAVASAGPEEWGLARYDTAGNLDTSFGSGGIVTSSAAGGEPHAAALQTNGQIVVAGWTSGTPSSPSQFEVGRYNPDGSVDSTFGSGGFVTTASGSSGGGYGVVIQSDGKIVVAGYGTIAGKEDFMLARYLPSDPEIGSFTASPNPVVSGSSTTLTASNITDGNPGATVTQVAIYLDSNGDGKLEPGTDTLLGYATQTSPGVWTFTYTVNLPSGSTYTLFAQAQDSDNVLGDPFALPLTVQ